MGFKRGLRRVAAGSAQGAWQASPGGGRQAWDTALAMRMAGAITPPQRRLGWQRLTTQPGAVWLALGLLTACALFTTAALAQATSPGSAASSDTALPNEVRLALARANLPPSALSLWVQQVDAPAPRLAWGAQTPVNPASLFKLVTTLAALELLGPQHTWVTPVWLGGPVRQGVLDGPLVIKGSGDPRLTVERVWLMLRRVQQQGVREIRGDIVLDRSAFGRPEAAPGDFDGEPLRPYNVAADALLLAQRSLIYSFTPDPARGVAVVTVEPTLQGHQVDAEVPLSNGPCDDWRGGLQATPADTQRMRFAGSYPASCGERNWPLAWPDPASFDARLLQGLWRQLGGTLRGKVRDGAVPAALANTAPSFSLQSPPLAEVVRDINKYSNNTLAQQLFLTLGQTQRGSGTPDASRQVVQQWLAQALPDLPPDALVVDNGSGLSRSNRLSAEALGQLLLRAWRGPLMPELLASLPVVGLDGTARRSKGAVGRAHLKTGSLRDVAGVAGIVHAANGRRWVMVALLQHPQAGGSRAVLDAVQQWVLQGAEANP